MAWWKRAVFSCIFYCKDQCEKRKRTVAYHCKICAVRFMDLYGIIKMYLHFLQCITSGAKMLMGLFFLGWTSMNVARNDIITQISGLVGNLCVGQLCVGWRYHQIISRLTSFSEYSRASTFMYGLVIKNDNGRVPFSRGNYITNHPQM